jgi:hypothetical protein
MMKKGMLKLEEHCRAANFRIWQQALPCSLRRHVSHGSHSVSHFVNEDSQ